MLGSQANQEVWDTWQYGWCCSDNTAACTKLGCDAKCASTSCYQQSNMQQCLSMFTHYGLSNVAVSYHFAKFRLFGVWFVSLWLFTKKNKNRYHQTIRTTGINTLMFSPFHLSYCFPCCSYVGFPAMDLVEEILELTRTVTQSALGDQMQLVWYISCLLAWT